MLTSIQLVESPPYKNLDQGIIWISEKQEIEKSDRIGGQRHCL
jgi:hypothetical protein